MYDMGSGKQTARFLFDVGLSKMCIDTSQANIYVGTVAGSIYKVSLHTAVSDIIYCCFLIINNKRCDV